MSKNITAPSNVIQFRFETREVRTMLIDDQPWFVATDVALALQYAEAKDMTRNLDDDEKGRQNVPTLGGSQEMLVINESGLYSAILRSRKAEAKRFKKWVTAEVLPAIRKHGKYEDEQGRMATLIGQTIGTDGFHCLAAVLDGKLRKLKGGAKRAAKNHVWQQVHRAFSVVRAEDIPADQLDSARCFVAAYDVREGEFIEAEKPSKADRLDIHYPVECLLGRRPGMLSKYNESHDSLKIALADLNHRHESPCEQIMHTLTNAGYDVDAAFWEIRTFRNKAEAFDRALSHLNSVFDAPQDYVIKKVGGRAVA